jgi:hypothetical protein
MRRGAVVRASLGNYRSPQNPYAERLFESVTSAGLLSLDFACRGAAAALGALMAIVFLRDYGAKKAGLAAAMSFSGAAYAIAMAPGLPSGWWSPPLAILWGGGTVIFWLWARAAFDDDFRLKPWHGALWAAVVVVRLLFDHGGAFGPLLPHSLSMSINHGATALNLVLSLLAVAQTVTTWGSDLVAGRRRLRTLPPASRRSPPSTRTLLPAISVGLSAAPWWCWSSAGA